MSINVKDRSILRELGEQVAEIAALPVQQETIASWKALNGLNPERGMVMIDQISWHEMNVDDELTLQTEDGFIRELNKFCPDIVLADYKLPGFDGLAALKIHQEKCGGKSMENGLKPMYLPNCHPALRFPL